MPNLHCPPYIRKFADLTKNLVNNSKQCSYYLTLKMLIEYFFGEYDSVSELVRCNSWTLSESQFLHIILGFDGNRFIKRMRLSILRKYKGELSPNNFVLAIDDTDNPKYSAYLSHVQSWKSSKGYYYGQKILVIALVDVKRKFALPLDFRICLPRKDQKKNGGESGIDFAFELAVKAVNDFGNMPVVSDSWFDSSDLAVKMRNEGIIYVWELKCNRKAKERPGKHNSWVSLSEIFSQFERYNKNTINKKWISESLIVLKSKRTQVKAIAVYNRKNGKNAFGYYATTDRTMPGAKVWKIFRDRWNIECLFYDLKNHLNFGRLSVSDDKVNKLAFVIPFFIITYLRLSPESFNLKKGMTIKGMLKTLETIQSISTFEQLLSPKGPAFVKKIKIRMSRINTKPIIKGAEEKLAA